MISWDLLSGRRRTLAPANSPSSPRLECGLTGAARDLATLPIDGNVEGHAASGMMASSPEMGDFPNYWGVSFYVDDCDAAAATAAANGAVVIAEPFDVPEVGRIAVVRDPQGAVFSLMTYETPID